MNQGLVVWKFGAPMFFLKKNKPPLKEMEFWVDEFAYSKWGRIRIPIGFGFGTLPQDAKSDQQNYYILHV